MKNCVAVLCLLAAGAVGSASAQEGSVPKGVPHLDHVFVVMMENHGYGQLVGNPNAPFVNQYIKSANIANNYFAIGHPSSTNYLEIVGGSNFGVRSDNAPDWHNATCAPNIVAKTVVTDNPTSPAVCPIAGTGTDAETPAVDTTNECPGTPPCAVNDIDGIKSVPAAPTIGKTIADQLADHYGTWKSYQESLPPTGADNITYSDGFYTSNPLINPVPSWETQTLVDLYATKHNPFAYFRSIQEGENPNSSLKNVVGFEGKHGLFDDLISGNVPNFSLIAPNQCNDQHGRGNAGPLCDYDPNDNGTLNGLNPALIYAGDQSLRTIVKAIHNSRVWHDDRSAIVVVWDEDDYSVSPTVNRVLTIVDTNYGRHGVQSANFYTHFSVLKTIEGALELPCLNHACDASTHVMSDLFATDGDHDHDFDDRH